MKTMFTGKDTPEKIKVRNVQKQFFWILFCKLRHCLLCQIIFQGIIFPYGLTQLTN
jgi:hypothetical protein